MVRSVRHQVHYSKNKPRFSNSSELLIYTYHHEIEKTPRIYQRFVLRGWFEIPCIPNSNWSEAEDEENIWKIWYFKKSITKTSMKYYHFFDHKASFIIYFKAVECLFYKSLHKSWTIKFFCKLFLCLEFYCFV